MSGRFWLITVLTLIVVLLIGNKFIIPHFQSQPPDQILNTNQTTLTIADTTLNIEIADEPSEIQQGLSGRPALAPNAGMLFILSAKRIPTFWMKDMRIALDFIWIDGDRVVDITENIPPPASGTTDLQLLTYSPLVPVTKVLEVNAGFISSHQISIGDKVKIN